MKVTKELKVALALLLSTAIRQTPTCYRADWAKEDEVPDMVIGDHNDWWLKTHSDGTLYVQSRESEWNERTVEIAQKMQEIAEDYELMTKIRVVIQYLGYDSIKKRLGPNQGW